MATATNKAEIKGSNWRIVRYGNWLHFYGTAVDKASKLAKAYRVCKVNGHTYIQVKIADFPVKLTF